MGHAHTIRENPGQIAGIAALSAAIGAITAMLFTPRTGEQVRGGIGRRARHGKDTMMDKLHSQRNHMTDTIDDVKETAKDKTTQAAERTKSAADKAKSKTGR